MRPQGSVAGSPLTFAGVVSVVNLSAPTGKGGGATLDDLGRGGGSIFRFVLGEASWGSAPGELTRSELRKPGRWLAPLPRLP